MLEIGTIPTDFTLERYDTYSNVSLSDYPDKIIFLSFFDIINGWNWLKKLIEIYNTPELTAIAADVQFIAVCYNYMDAGTETIGPFSFGGAIEHDWIQRKITDDSSITTVPFPVLVDNAWASSRALDHANGFSTDINFGSSPGTNLFSYLITKDNLISDKWSENTISSNHPSSFKRMEIPAVLPFDSTDYDNTADYVIQRLINLNTDPAVTLANPVEGTVLSSLTPIEIVFSKPVVDAANLPGSYSTGGTGAGAPTIAVASYTGDNKVENVATVTPGGTLATGTVTISAGAAVTDTEGNALTDNDVDFTADVTGPTISSGTVASDNSTITVTFDEGLYANSDGTGALQSSDFSLAFTQNSGTATGVALGTVTHTAGSDTAIIALTVTGTPSGVETVAITPIAASIYDLVGNAALASTTTGDVNLNDTVAPPTVLNVRTNI